MSERKARSRKKRPNETGRPKRTLSTPDARLEIREAALELFSKRGFSTVTSADIAEATGFTPALIYYYFGSKEELFREAVRLAVERAFEQFRRSREGLEHPGDILDRWIETHILQYDAIAKLIMIALDYSKMPKRKARIDDAIRSFYDEEREVLIHTLKSGVARGVFRKVDVEETSTFISTYLDGAFVRAIMLKNADPIAAIRQLKSFLGAYLAP